MKLQPLADESKDSRGERTPQHVSCGDFDLRFFATMFDVKMWRRMIFEVHLDHDSEEAADTGHGGFLSSGLGEHGGHRHACDRHAQARRRSRAEGVHVGQAGTAPPCRRGGILEPPAVKALASLGLGTAALRVTAADLKCSKARAGPTPHGTTATVDRPCCVIPPELAGNPCWPEPLQFPRCQGTPIPKQRSRIRLSAGTVKAAREAQCSHLDHRVNEKLRVN